MKSAVCSCFTDGFILPAVPSTDHSAFFSRIIYFSSNALPNSVQSECLTVMLLCFRPKWAPFLRCRTDECVFLVLVTTVMLEFGSFHLSWVSSPTSGSWTLKTSPSRMSLRKLEKKVSAQCSFKPWLSFQSKVQVNWLLIFTQLISDSTEKDQTWFDLIKARELDYRFCKLPVFWRRIESFKPSNFMYCYCLFFI